MKIEIGESLCYSYLRHVKGCWLVQTNWKASEHWTKCKTDAELETMFLEMRQRFDLGGNVFKQTATVNQFMQQGEIDVMGIDQHGGVHVMDVAFHEASLNYGGGVANRVLKKLLRAFVLLSAYHPQQSPLHIYFVSPKVHRSVQSALENVYAALREQYPEANWHLITNENFHDQILQPTLAKGDSVADTAELFVRAAKLLTISGATVADPVAEQHVRPPTEIPISRPRTSSISLQDLVRGLMKTLLEECPDLLDESELQHLTDHRYCSRQLELKISNLGLLREQQHGREINGRNRYWRNLYAGRFYVCSQWWKDHHVHNANSLLMFLDSLSRAKPNHPDISTLDVHKARLREFVSAG
jgi:hypothetical protein